MNIDLSPIVDSFGSYIWIFIPIGLFLGLLGFRMHRFSLFFIGLFAGFVVGSWLGDYLENSQLGLLIGVILGGFLGILNQFLLRFSLFLAGMTGGFIAANLLLPEFGFEMDAWQTILWTMVSALIGGLLTVIFYRFLVLVITSIIGTYFIFVGTIQVFPEETASWSWTLYAVLLIVFILVQSLTLKDFSDSLSRRRKRRYSSNSHRHLMG